MLSQLEATLNETLYGDPQAGVVHIADCCDLIAASGPEALSLAFSLMLCPPQSQGAKVEAPLGVAELKEPGYSPSGYALDLSGFHKKALAQLTGLKVQEGFIELKLLQHPQDVWPAHQKQLLYILQLKGPGENNPQVRLVFDSNAKKSFGDQKAKLFNEMRETGERKTKNSPMVSAQPFSNRSQLNKSYDSEGPVGSVSSGDTSPRGPRFESVGTDPELARISQKNFHDAIRIVVGLLKQEKLDSFPKFTDESEALILIEEAALAMRTRREDLNDEKCAVKLIVLNTQKSKEDVEKQKDWKDTLSDLQQDYFCDVINLAGPKATFAKEPDIASLTDPSPNREPQSAYKDETMNAVYTLLLERARVLKPFFDKRYELMLAPQETHNEISKKIDK